MWHKIDSEVKNEFMYDRLLIELVQGTVYLIQVLLLILGIYYKYILIGNILIKYGFWK